MSHNTSSDVSVIHMSLDMTLTLSAKLDSEINNVRDTNDTEMALTMSVTLVTVK